MAAVTTSSVILLSSNPNDALIFSVNERGEECTQVQAVPAAMVAEPSCATTKAIEVCVNGVKQVIIIPPALSSDSVTTVSSGAFQPNYLPSSSSVDDNALLDDRPDDVKLLIDSCVRLSSSSSVSSVSNTGLLSAATNGHAQASTGLTSNTNSPLPYHHLFSTNHLPVANVPTNVQRNPYVAATPQFHPNSIDFRATLPSSAIPHLSPSFPVPPNLSVPLLPIHGFPPVQQCTTSPLAPLQQTFPFSADRNTVLPGQILPGSNHLHLLQSAVSQISQSSWTPYCPLQVRPTCGRNDTAMDTVVNNYLHLRSAVTVPQPPFDSSLPNHGVNYRHFLPSLPSVLTPNLPLNQPSVQFQDYFARKRGVLPQNPAQGLQVNSGSNLTRPTYHVPQFDPRFFNSPGFTNPRPPPVTASEVLTSPGFTNPRPPPVTASEVRTSYQSYSFSSNRSYLSSYLSHHNLNAGNAGRKKGTKKQRSVPIRVTDSVSNTNVHPFFWEKGACDLPSVSHQLLQPLTSHITSTVCQTTASSAALMIPVQSKQAKNNSAVTSTQPTSLPELAIAVTSRQSVASVPTDLQVTVSQTMSLTVTAIATSPVRTVTTYVTETTCNPTPVTQMSATTNSNSAENTTLETLLFDVHSKPTATDVPSNFSLTSDPSLSNLLSTDLFPLNSDPAADSGHTVTGSDAVQQNGTALEIGTCQLGDSSNDSDSLPADVVVDTADSESLLMSFCNLFEQSNAADQDSAPVSSLKNSLNNGELQSETSIDVHRESAERGLQFAKSLGKGRHFADEMRQRRQEQASRKRRRTQLTSLEVVDESNSSDSWHPGSQSESSDYLTPSPAPSTASSVSGSSDDFVVMSPRAKKRRQLTHGKQKQSSRRRVVCSAQKPAKVAVHNLRPAVTEKCSVMLERLNLRGRQTVNVHLVDSIVCCLRHRRVKYVQRVVSSDSDSSVAGAHPTRSLRIKIPRIQDTDSS